MTTIDDLDVFAPGALDSTPASASSPCRRWTSPRCWPGRCRPTPPATTARTGPASPPGAPSTGYVALPAAPATVAAYLQDQAQVRTETGERRYAVATLTRWVAAIGFVHRAHAAIDQAGAGGGGGEGSVAEAMGEPGRSELVRATLAALRRDYTRHRDRPTRRVAPLLLDDITRILDRHPRGRRHLDHPGAGTPRQRPDPDGVRRRVSPQRTRRPASSATSSTNRVSACTSGSPPRRPTRTGTATPRPSPTAHPPTSPAHPVPTGAGSTPSPPTTATDEPASSDC